MRNMIVCKCLECCLFFTIYSSFFRIRYFTLSLKDAHTALLKIIVKHSYFIRKLMDKNTFYITFSKLNIFSTHA